MTGKREGACSERGCFRPRGEVARDPRSGSAEAKRLIAPLQQNVQAWMDGDQVLPADGSSLLALLERALEGLAGKNTAAARAGIEAFVERVQALIDARILDGADGHPLIEAAAPLRAWLRSAGGTGWEREPGDLSSG